MIVGGSWAIWAPGWVPSSVKKVVLAWVLHWFRESQFFGHMRSQKLSWGDLGRSWTVWRCSCRDFDIFGRGPFFVGRGLGDLIELLGRSWAGLGPSWDPLGPILGHLGPILGHLGTSWAVLGPSWGSLGSSWGHLGSILGASWVHLGTSWDHLAATGAI